MQIKGDERKRKCILKRSLHWHKKLLKDCGRGTLMGFAKQKKYVLYKSEIYVIFISVI